MLEIPLVSKWFIVSMGVDQNNQYLVCNRDWGSHILKYFEKGIPKQGSYYCFSIFDLEVFLQIFLLRILQIEIVFKYKICSTILFALQLYRVQKVYRELVVQTFMNVELVSTFAIQAMLIFYICYLEKQKIKSMSGSRNKKVKG